MPEPTPTPSLFGDAYVAGTAPWVIDEPQPAVDELERRGGLVGAVLDLGCGTGEHTLLLAGRGYDVVGVDAAPAAVDRARALAEERGVTAHFAVGDALHPEGLGEVDTVLDSALFHIFAPADRPAYADALAAVVRPGGRVVVLALAAEGGSGFGPEIAEDAVATTFTAPRWSLEAQEKTVYRGRIVSAEQAEQYGVPVGGRLDLPAWLATVRRR